MWRIKTTTYENGVPSGTGISCKSYESKTEAIRDASLRTFREGNIAVVSTVVDEKSVVISV